MNRPATDFRLALLEVLMVHLKTAQADTKLPPLCRRHLVQP